MKRRITLTALGMTALVLFAGGAAVGANLGILAQQPTDPVLGSLTSGGEELRPDALPVVQSGDGALVEAVQAPAEPDPLSFEDPVSSGYHDDDEHEDEEYEDHESHDEFEEHDSDSRRSGRGGDHDDD